MPERSHLLQRGDGHANHTQDPLTLRIDGGLVALMKSRRFSIAMTLSPDGLLLLGLNPEGKLHIEHRYIPFAFALAYDGNKLAISSRQEIVVYGNSSLLASTHPEYPGRYDAFFTPQVSFFTGACNVHDMVITRQGLVVANTRFSTVCLIDGQYHFNPIWHPAFISAPVAEDRCHLNGLVVSDDQLRYVTAFGPCDQQGGWRATDGFQGVLVDVVRDTILLGGLSMPHSPRLIDGRLLVLESGFGGVLEVDPNNGKKRCLFRLPGMTRGLCVEHGILFVGLSHRRPSQLHWHLPIDNLDTPLQAGVVALEADTGKVVGLVEILNPGREVFDVKLLPNITCPGIADPNKPDNFYLVDSPAGSYWLMSPNPEHERENEQKTKNSSAQGTERPQT